MKKLLFTTDKEDCRKSQTIKMQRTKDYVSPSPNQSISNITDASKAQEPPGKREQTDCKSLRDMTSAEIVFSSNIKEVAPIRCQQHDHLNKEDTSRHTNAEEKEILRTPTLDKELKAYTQLSMLSTIEKNP